MSKCANFPEVALTFLVLRIATKVKLFRTESQKLKLVEGGQQMMPTTVESVSVSLQEIALNFVALTDKSQLHTALTIARMTVPAQRSVSKGKAIAFVQQIQRNAS